MAIIDLSETVGTRKCPDGFISEYLKYTSRQESPQDFHQWVAITILATAVARNCYKDRGYYKLYPNLYVVLTAESATLHKSTALNIGVKMLRAAFGEKKHVFAQKITPAAMMSYLAELTTEMNAAEALIHASEFAVFLGRTNLDPTLLELLTDLYDAPDLHIYSTIGRGTQRCENICISMLAGTTPEWLKGALPEESIGGGFFSRLLIICRKETDRSEPFPEDIVGDNTLREAKDNCIHDLIHIGNLKGSFTWTNDARLFFEDWYSDFNQVRAAECDHAFKGYYGRKADTLIKIAMILSLDVSDDMVLEEKYLVEALALLNDNEGFMKSVTKYLGQTEAGRDAETVYKYIEKKVEVTHSGLLRAMSYKYNARMLNDILDSLEQAKAISVKREGGKVYRVERDLIELGSKS